MKKQAEAVAINPQIKLVKKVPKLNLSDNFENIATINPDKNEAIKSFVSPKKELRKKKPLYNFQLYLLKMSKVFPP